MRRVAFWSTAAPECCLGFGSARGGRTSMRSRSPLHLDHWGDLVPWVWGSMYRAAGVTIDDRPELWVHQGGRDVLEQFGERFGFKDMFDRVFTVREYAPEEPFTAGGIDILPARLPHYTLETYGFRLSADGVSVAYSVTAGQARGSQSSPVTDSLCARRPSRRAPTTVSRAAT